MPVPALEALLRFEQERTSGRIELERLEPVDPRETVPDLPAPFRVLEVRDERVDRRRLEPERRRRLRASLDVIAWETPSS